MVDVFALAETHREVANKVSVTAPINLFAADLVMRNTVVMSDRLVFFQFNELSQETRDTVYEVAGAITQLAVSSGRSIERRPSESEGAFAYRSSVQWPLIGLQTILHIKHNKLEHESSEGTLRTAISDSGEAFASMLLETQNLPVLHSKEMLRYFAGNTEAAEASLHPKD